MKIGVITGSGTYALEALREPQARAVTTRFGTVHVSEGHVDDVSVVHLARHGPGHARLSNHVTHRANIAALASEGVDAILAVTVCGAVDPGAPLGSLVVFDDLHFLQNRLPDGSLCTLYDEPAGAGRGHWIFQDPFAGDVRRALVEAAREAGHPARDGGCYGHVDGPRFNTRAEIRSLAAVGVTAVSQTGGPETVLAGEAEIPYALVGYLTDYAKGVMSEATPVSELKRLMDRSNGVFREVLVRAIRRLAASAGAATAAGEVYRFG
jgi:purine nucleoside phosphorylase